jgi:predicted GNAT family acetyltransferase
MSWLALAGTSRLVSSSRSTSHIAVYCGTLGDLDWQGKGVGRQLIACAVEHARKLGLTSLTLTTFRDVPWNAPFYARLGFEIVTELTPELRQKREEEAAHGLAYDSRYAAYRNPAGSGATATRHNIRTFPSYRPHRPSRFYAPSPGATVFAEANSRAFICSC